MSDTSVRVTDQPVPQADPDDAAAPPRPARRRRRWLGAGLVVVLVGGGAGTALALTRQDPTAAAGVVDNAYPTGVATVARRALSSQTSVNATLGYSGSYSVLNQAQGTLTWLPAVGDVVTQGHALYQVDGTPVLLLYGTRPFYRTLKAGMSGPDVRQLNAALVALGYAKRSQLDPASDYFGWRTTAAVEKLQDHLDVTQTGSFAPGQVVFLPGALRITSLNAVLGGSAAPGGAVETATSTAPTVTIALDAAQQGEVKVGDPVTITLPDGRTTPGVVSSVGTVATTPSGGDGSDSTPTITVQVTPKNPTALGGLDQAPVQVAITTGTVADALVVPVTALLALSGGGYAVEEIGADGVRRLRPVTVGLVDDASGLVQVTGPGLAAGQRVVVPAS